MTDDKSEKKRKHQPLNLNRYVTRAQVYTNLTAVVVPKKLARLKSGKLISYIENETALRVV